MSTQDLHLACKTGNISSIKLAYESNPKRINEKDTQLGWTALYRTVISSRLEAAKFLLQQGADPNTPNNLGETSLHQAADNGNIHMAKLLIEFGAKVNHQQNEGDTPLHHAAFRGDAEMVLILLQEKGNPNIKNYVSGRTPLHYAVDCGYMDCVEIMMGYGADAYIQDNMKRRAFELTEDLKMREVLEKSAFQIENVGKKDEDFGGLEEFGGVLESDCCGKAEKVDEDYEVFGNDKFVSDLDGDYSQMINRGSFSVEKISDLMKNSKTETTALSSHKSTGQNKLEIYPIYDWLEKIQLAQYYELIVSAGFTSLDLLIKNPAIVIRVVIDNVSTPGHKRRLLFHLYEETKNESKNVIKDKKSNKSFFKCCGASSGNTQGFYSIPSVLDWLKEIHMERYFESFTKTGYDDYESLVLMCGSDFALNEEVLKEDLKITNEKHKKRILKKIEADHLNFCSRMSVGRISFDEPKNVACESCEIF